jgi:hypothetical protein
MTNLGWHFMDMAFYLTGSEHADVLSSVYHYINGYELKICDVSRSFAYGASASITTVTFFHGDGVKRDCPWKLPRRTVTTLSVTTALKPVFSAGRPK